MAGSRHQQYPARRCRTRIRSAPFRRSSGPSPVGTNPALALLTFYGGERNAARERPGRPAGSRRKAWRPSRHAETRAIATKITGAGAGTKGEGGRRPARSEDRRTIGISRAFVKEGDDNIDDLPERSISAHLNDVTREGLAQIESEVTDAQKALAAAQGAGDRPAIARASRDLRYWSARHGTANVAPQPRTTTSWLWPYRDDYPGRWPRTDVSHCRRRRSRSCPGIDFACVAVGSSAFWQACWRCRTGRSR